MRRQMNGGEAAFPALSTLMHCSEEEWCFADPLSLSFPIPNFSFHNPTKSFIPTSLSVI